MNHSSTSSLKKLKTNLGINERNQTEIIGDMEEQIHGELALIALKVALQECPQYFQRKKKSKKIPPHPLYQQRSYHISIYKSCDITLVSRELTSLDIAPQCRPFMTSIISKNEKWIRITENERHRTIRLYL